jgi:predicted transposase/invertase (TIGR01784 family)
MSENTPNETLESSDKAKALIPAYRDTFVHFLFASPGNEPILLHFLNAILESDGQPPSHSVEVRNPFNPAKFLMEKRTILDIRAKGKQGDIFQVEFQTTERLIFADRMTFYGAKTFGEQLSKGDSYSTLRTMLAIAVTAFEMFWQLEKIHNSFRLTAKADSSIVFTEKFQLHTLEVCKEKIDRVGDLPPALGAWTNFFYYSHLKTTEEMMTLLQECA